MSDFRHFAENVIDIADRATQKHAQNVSALADLALDRCEEAFERAEWSRFGYWFDVFVRERTRLSSRK